MNSTNLVKLLSLTNRGLNYTSKTECILILDKYLNQKDIIDGLIDTGTNGF